MKQNVLSFFGNIKNKISNQTFLCVLCFITWVEGGVPEYTQKLLKRKKQCNKDISEIHTQQLV